MPHLLELRTAAWFGDSPLQIDFPAAWEVEVQAPPALPALDPEALQAALRHPIGARPLRDLAAGRQRAVILIDDLSRPTPMPSLLPPVLAELNAGGLSDAQITVVIAGGAHAPEPADDIERKLGAALTGRVRVIAHDCRQDLVLIGRSPAGIPIWVNQHVMAADLKIGIGAIYPHPAAGFSGGAKILAPAACGFETIRRLHDDLRPAWRRGGTLDTELRREIEAIAELAGLDFICNAVLNQERQAAALFAGHPVEAHRAGVAFVEARYRVAAAPEAQVVIADMYPFDLNLQFANDRGLWPVRDRGAAVSKVMVAACPHGVGSHTLFPVANAFTTRLARRLRTLNMRLLRDLPVRLGAARDLMAQRQLELLVLSPGLAVEPLRKVFPRAQLFAQWAALRRVLEDRHPGAVKVAVYRGAPLCLPPARS